MSEYIKIVAIVIAPYLVGGALLYFTRRDPKRRFYMLMPLILAVTLWLGFPHGWRTSDFVQFSMSLLVGIGWWFAVFRAPQK